MIVINSRGKNLSSLVGIVNELTTPENLNMEMLMTGIIKVVMNTNNKKKYIFCLDIGSRNMG
jgi:hypothetical protein